MSTNVSDRLLTGNDFSVFVSKQTEKGKIDPNPVFTPYRRTEGKGLVAMAYTQSALVKSNRQAPLQIKDGAEYTAEISSELNKQAIADMISAIHAVEQVRTSTSSEVSSDASGFDSGSDEMFAGVEVGDYIWMDGFADPALNRAYRVTVKSSNSAVDVYPVPESAESAGASVTMRGHKSANAKAQTLYAVQTRALDESKVGGVDYQTFFDAVINTMSVEIPETGISTYSVSMMAENMVPGTSLINGQTDAPELTDDSVSAYDNIVDWFVNGTSAKCEIKSMTLEINNNYQADSAAGCHGKRYSFGDIGVTGSIVVRSPISSPFVWRDYYLDGRNVEIGVHLTHGDGDDTIIVIRSAKIVENSMPDGSNVASNSEASFAGQESITTNTTIEVFRNWE